MINLGKSKAFKLVVAGLLLCIGILLPFVTAHAFGISGNIFLPMHIPVFLCGFLCGPLMGGICGLVLPTFNSFLTGMPVFFPNAILMTVELFLYGFISGMIYKLLKRGKKLMRIYISLITAMIIGRIASGATAWLLLVFGTKLFKYSVLAGLLTGIPGIIIQLIIIPILISIFQKDIFVLNKTETKAIKMIKEKSVNCVVVRNKTIEKVANQKGIKFLMELHEKKALENAFVADSVVGKAAAMIMSLSGVKKCYAYLISDSAYNWLNEQNIKVYYKKKVPFIINRNKTGMCPMESAVIDINDHFLAYEILKEKLKQITTK